MIKWNLVFVVVIVQFGGGRVINPGEALETAEEKAAKDARTRELIAAYKKKVGMNVHPKLKSECEEVSSYQIFAFSTY